ncbi:hypothetical protein EPA93_19625 [Ktedonosporobacter rubrisoli]|uniref:Uncharacterized protein n=1 Tax=Ktedonosporobacter rubrisoli TaxID=2509675 RepID=A0A4P6JRY3_KTERU|nr:hypothetical protein [Ktedonosporobacter rubrisoli]QBD78085.1 hypothetical protein EPA93_19625 [Ktedonosporobacter rubrisoli]
MRKWLWFRRLILVFFLILAISAGWFLHGIISPSHAKPKHPQVRNTPIKTVMSPMSSTIQDPQSAERINLRSNTGVRSRLFQLTAGLRPGRGDPVPEARDVHELPVADVAFYNWRGELLSGWLALSSPRPLSLF